MQRPHLKHSKGAHNLGEVVAEVFNSDKAIAPELDELGLRNLITVGEVLLGVCLELFVHSVIQAHDLLLLLFHNTSHLQCRKCQYKKTAFLML